MEKIKLILKHFLIAELISIVTVIISGFFLINEDSGGFISIFIIILYIIYVTKWNIFLSFVFYYINDNITKTISLISIVILFLVAIYLSYYRNYYQSLSLDKYPNSFMRDNIDKVLIFLSLIINQFLMKF
ncbi:hypothetical protein BXU01_18385 [[Flexibacter] sp. ATCC 35103]|nr:hypothetical protein BXU01_18120 [[Flexibacter] sp. ATCC 35103]OMQ09329.1 hypothetical protein BXU01_18385 [[Flexibacter] sp. ATCC 35103]